MAEPIAESLHLSPESVNQPSDAHIEYLRKEHTERLRDYEEGKITREQYLNIQVQRDLVKEAEVTTDKLTGLLNYTGFLQALTDEFTSLENVGEEHREKVNTGKQGVLIFADGDDLKKINDTLGHEAGNLAIKTLAFPLKKKLRPKDIKARYGGDEFVCFIPHVSIEQGVLIAKRIQGGIPQEGEDIIPGLSLSIGIVPYIPGVTPEELVKQGDLTMYDAKQTDKGSIAVYGIQDPIQLGHLHSFIQAKNLQNVHIFTQHLPRAA